MKQNEMHGWQTVWDHRNHRDNTDHRDNSCRDSRSTWWCVVTCRGTFFLFAWRLALVWFRISIFFISKKYIKTYFQEKIFIQIQTLVLVVDLRVRAKEELQCLHAVLLIVFFLFVNITNFFFLKKKNEKLTLYSSSKNEYMSNSLLPPSSTSKCSMGIKEGRSLRDTVWTRANSFFAVKEETTLRRILKNHGFFFNFIFWKKRSD